MNGPAIVFACFSMHSDNVLNGVSMAVGVMEKALYSSYTWAHRPKGEGIYFLSLTTSDWTSAGLPKMRSKMSVLMA